MARAKYISPFNKHQFVPLIVKFYHYQKLNHHNWKVVILHTMTKSIFVLILYLISTLTALPIIVIVIFIDSAPSLILMNSSTIINKVAYQLSTKTTVSYWMKRIMGELIVSYKGFHVIGHKNINITSVPLKKNDSI